MYSYSFQVEALKSNFLGIRATRDSRGAAARSWSLFTNYRVPEAFDNPSRTASGTLVHKGLSVPYVKLFLQLRKHVFATDLTLYKRRRPLISDCTVLGIHLGYPRCSAFERYFRDPSPTEIRDTMHIKRLGSDQIPR